MPATIDLSWPQLLAMLAAVVAAGIVRGFSGFGAGLVMVPALTLLIGPVLAVPMVVLLEIAASTQLVPGALRLARWGTVAPLGLAACLAVPLGSMALASLDPRWLQRAISVIVLVFVGILSTGWRYRRQPTTPVTAATGLASGLLTGMAGVGGPPVILLLLSGPNPAPHVRASLICFFAVTQVAALVAFFGHGLLNTAVLGRALLLAPVFLGATWAGTRLFGRVDERVFRMLTLLFLAVLAVSGLLL